MDCDLLGLKPEYPQTTTANDGSHEPTNGQFMNILQTLLHNQQQDHSTIRDGMKSIHERLGATDHRLEHHELIIEKLDDKINHLQEAAASATAAPDPEAGLAFVALHTRLAVLEAGQRQPGATSAIPVLGALGVAGGEFAIVLGNFPHDTPADEALRAARRLLVALPNGPRLVPPPSPFSASTSADAPQAAGTGTRTWSATDPSATYQPPACRIYAPYALISTIYVAFMNPAFGRQVIQEAKDRCRREMNFMGSQIRLHAGSLKTREERLRNKKLMAAATVVQAALSNDEPDKRNEPWTLVCWRSGTVVVSKRRTCTLARTGELTFTSGWHDAETSIAPEAEMKASIEAAIARRE